MDLTFSEEDTKRFLSAIHYRYALSIFERVCQVYELSEEQKEAVNTVLFSPSKWKVEIKAALNN